MMLDELMIGVHGLYDYGSIENRLGPQYIQA